MPVTIFSVHVAAVGAVAVPAVLELAGGVVANTTTAARGLSTYDARLRVGELAAARQLQLQERADALEGNATAVHDAAALTHRGPGGAIKVIPEFSDRRMRRAPFVLELLDFFVGELLRLEFPPGTEPARVAESEIASFADAAFGRCFVEAAGRYAEDFARGGAVRLVARIVRRVEAAIAFELPFFAGDPRQHAAFDRC